MISNREGYGFIPGVGKLTKEYAQLAEAVVGSCLFLAMSTAFGLLAGCIWGAQTVAKKAKGLDAAIRERVM